MVEKTSPSIKSAYELALARLAQREGQGPALTAEQKKALAAVDQKTKAKIAELEIMGASRLAAAPDNLEQIEKLKAEQRVTIEKIRAQAEAEKEKIRRPGG